VPDFYSLGISSLQGLRSKYGVHSVEYRAALFVLDMALSQVVEYLEELYEGRLLAEVLSLPRQDYISLPNTRDIVDTTKTTLLFQLADKETLEKYYPVVYFNKEVMGMEREDACQQLGEALIEVGAEVQCLPEPASLRSMRADLGNSTGDGTTKEVETFQIVLWSSILLVLITIAASSVMFTIDASKSTWIYNQHNQINVPTV